MNALSLRIPQRVRLGFLLGCALVPAALSSAAEPSGQNLLHDAIQRGDTAKWRALLADKAEVNARDEKGNTPLHYAALRGDAKAVEALLEHGAEAGATNNAHATPLHYGTASERIVAALLARGAPADSISKVGVTPLLAAVAQHDAFNVVRRLVNAGANVNHHRAFPLGPRGQASVLAMAALTGDRRTVELLLDHGAEVNPAVGVSPLSSAALAGELDVAKLLLDRGADINRRSDFAGTPLNFAFFGGQTEMIRFLIERGADPNIPSTRGHATPPMVWSAYNDDGDPAFARMLLARGADIDAANDYGETALSYALKRGPDTPLVKFLRESGAKPPALLRAERTRTVPSRTLPADNVARGAMIRDSVQRGIALLQRNSTAFLENGFVANRTRCVSCHQQALPAVAFGLARERGFRLDEHELGRQLFATISQRGQQAENAREMDEPTPAADVTLGFDLDGLHALNYARDDITDGLTHYLLGTQHRNGRWAAVALRPPLEDGLIVGTAWTVRALQLYPPTGRERDAERAVRRAGAWLAAQEPRLHNHRVFQLLGLAWADEKPERLRPLAENLIQGQRTDGGWSQLPALAPDAWATGSALVALHKAGIAISHPAYQRGLDFLLRTQFDDGSWWVPSRSWPFQPHFDGKFPHGKDQWISAAGTAWATIALLLTMDPQTRPERLPDGQTLIAKFVARNSALVAKADASPSPVPTGRTTVHFSRDIKPLIERSCAGCHVGEKVRGEFSLASRESLLKGGQSGDPAIVPGRSAQSHLLRYVSDQIEDLEMPPLAKREKYPALTAAEIVVLRDWIDAGAPWDEAATESGAN